MKMSEKSLLNEELDYAISWYHQLTQDSSLSRLGRGVLYYTGRAFSSQWDPLKALESSAALAFVEAAAKNDLAYLEKLLPLPYINNDAKYYALVAAVQGGCTRAIEFLLKLIDLEEVVSTGIGYAHTYFAIDKYFKAVDYQAARQMEGNISLYARMGFSTEPNLLIEAARHNRLDVIRHLQQFQFIRNMLNSDSYGYYACLRAAEFGHLKVMNEFLNIQNLRNEILVRGDALRFAAMNGHLDIVDRLLEFGLPHNMNLVSFITSVLHYGTVMVVNRILQEDDIHDFFNYDGDDPAQINEIEDAAFYACYLPSTKSDETAARMFNLLMQYPVVARMAAKNSAAGSGAVWETLQNIDKLNLNRVHAVDAGEDLVHDAETSLVLSHH